MRNNEAPRQGDPTISKEFKKTLREEVRIMEEIMMDDSLSREEKQEACRDFAKLIFEEYPEDKRVLYFNENLYITSDDAENIGSDEIISWDEVKNI